MPNFTLLIVFKFVTGGLTGGVIANRNAMVANINYEKGAQFLANVVIVNSTAALMVPLLAGVIID